MPARSTPVAARIATDPMPGNDWTNLESAASRYRNDDVLTVADAACLARRSVRTLRRAYLSGKLTAHRDGNGRGVSIRYGDLRAWLTAAVIAPAPPVASSPAIARADVRGRFDAPTATGNQALLSAALQQRKRRTRPAAGPRPARSRAGTGRR